MPRPAPSGNCTAFAQYLHKLGAAAAAAASTPAERDAATLKLLACAYSVHVSHLTGGVRIGAAASERLQLLERGAVATYTDYPGLSAQDEPVGVFSSCVDAAGDCLNAAQREAVCEELPGAFVKAGLVLSALAHED